MVPNGLKCGYSKHDTGPLKPFVSFPTDNNHLWEKSFSGFADEKENKILDFWELK